MKPQKSEKNADDDVPVEPAQSWLFTLTPACINILQASYDRSFSESRASISGVTSPVVE
jgi:hypothetical protein